MMKDPLDYIEELETEIDELRAKMRRSKNAEHTWRLLYKDLLEKIGNKLNLTGELPHNNKENK